MGVLITKCKSYIFSVLKAFWYKIAYKNVTIGKRVVFRRNCYIYVENGGKLKIGDKCFFNNGCSINALDSVTIGERCLFGENVKIYDHNHKYADINTPIKYQGFSTKPVTIGNNCWICSNVTILKGVTIGNNVVIGAGCLIHEDIADNTVVKLKTELIKKTV